MQQENYLRILKKMILIRRFEERVAVLAENREFQDPVHLYVGQEAIASSVCEALNHQDYAYSTHRSHGHYLAKGGDVKKLMAEIFCKETGCSRGRGGSMHVIDRLVGFMGSSPIVGGTISIAVGSGLSAKMNRKGQVSVAFFGDGATDEGVFYESVNFAMIHKLPVIFVCENNRFSTHLPDFVRQSNPDVADRVAGFRINARRVNGNSPEEIFSVVSEMVDKARKGEGPSLIECMTYRWLSHVGYWKDLDVGFRKKTDVEHWMERCPIRQLSEQMITRGMLTRPELEEMERAAVAIVEESVEFARSSKSPDPAAIAEGLFS